MLFRSITDRFLPDKAIDLMDEASAKLRMEVDSVPEELDEISRRIKQLEIEREAIKREDDKPKEDILTKQIENLRQDENAMRAKWQSEKEIINKIQQSKIEIEDAKFQAEKAEREGNYGLVADLWAWKFRDANDGAEKALKLWESVSKDKDLLTKGCPLHNVRMCVEALRIFEV